MNYQRRSTAATQAQPLSTAGAAALAALERALQAAPVAALPAFIGELERLKLVAFARLLAADRRSPEPAQADPALLLTVREVAARLRCSEWNVYDMIRRQRLPAVPVGRLVRVRAGDLEAFLRAEP